MEIVSAMEVLCRRGQANNNYCKRTARQKRANLNLIGALTPRVLREVIHQENSYQDQEWGRFERRIVVDRCVVRQQDVIYRHRQAKKEGCSPYFGCPAERPGEPRNKKIEKNEAE